MALPDLLCIGAQKAGTTWLHSMLSQHPDIYRAPIRECHFFNTLHVPESKRQTRKKRVRKMLRKRIRKHKRKSRNPNSEKIAWMESLAKDKEILTAGWYERVFSGPGSEGKTKFEKTPAYSAIPLEAIKDVRSMLGDIPIVYIIRDPLNRMLSQIRWTALRRHGDDPLSESDWVDLFSNLHERGDYKTYIHRWLSVFPEENIHFIPFKKIPTEPESVLRYVEGLVGLPPHKYKHPSRKRKPSGRNDVPQSVIDLATEHVAPQYAFLEQHFGKEFMDLI
jgi:hypothetical protein